MLFVKTEKNHFFRFLFLKILKIKNYSELKLKTNLTN